MKPSHDHDAARVVIGRREVLRLVAAGTSLAACATTAKASPSTDIDTDKAKTRYRETEHVKTFYRVNRY